MKAGLVLIVSRGSVHRSRLLMLEHLPAALRRTASLSIANVLSRMKYMYECRMNILFFYVW